MNKRSWYFVAATVLLGLAVWINLPAPSLDIRQRDSRQLLLALPMPYDEPFTIWYLHSIARRPVEEKLHLAPQGTLVVDATIWDMNGTGLPYGPDPGMKFELKDGKYILTNMNRVFPEVVMAIGWVAKHRLIYHDRSLPLAKLAPPGTAIRLQVGRHPRWVLAYSQVRWLLLSQKLVPAQEGVE